MIEIDGEIKLDDMDPAGPGPEPSPNRRALVIGDQWVQDSLTELRQDIDKLMAVKRDRKQPVVYLLTPAEVLKAFEVGILTKAETRKIMGLKAIRQPAQLARAAAARRRPRR